MASPVTAPAGSALAEQIPLSFNQEFLCGFDRGDDEGPFGPRFHIVHGWRLRGPVDVPALRGALTDVVARHEALRSAIVRDPATPYQRIFPAEPPELVVREEPGLPPAERERRVEDLIIEVESGTIDVGRLPVLRVELTRFDETDSVLVLIVHHTATDGWSVRLIIRDLATFYAIRRGHGGELEPALQYREFAVWQKANAAGPDNDAARAYWREKLAGARVLSLPTDLPKSAGRPESTSVYRFLIEADLVTATLDLARATRSTPFMVMLGAFSVLVHRLTGETDIVVPTFTPGRGQDRFQNTVGPFFNYLPLRTDIAGCGTFKQVVDRVRATCLEAYSYDIPFQQLLAQAPELMLPTLEDNRAACVFQVFPFPFLLDGTLIGDLEYSEVRRRLRSQPIGSDVPNGALWTLNLDPAGDIVGGIQFNNNLFTEESTAGMVAAFRQALRDTVLAPAAPLAIG